MQSKYIIPVAVVALLGSAALGTMSVSAQATTTTQKTIVQKLAEKFNLKESDVQQVFDQDRTEHKAQMQVKIEDRLTQLVKDGKITEDQKQKILAKQKELEATMEANKNKFQTMTPEERRAEMEKQRTELEKWAKENGIDTQYLMKFGLRHGLGHHGGMKGDGHRPF